jgi:hypothetical protein
MKVLKISTLNKFYDRNTLKRFLNAIIDDLQIKFDIPDEDFKRLPKDGAYITISNHPLGGIDGVLLLKNVRRESLILKLLLIFSYTELPFKIISCRQSF